MSVRRDDNEVVFLNVATVENASVFRRPAGNASMVTYRGILPVFAIGSWTHLMLALIIFVRGGTGFAIARADLHMCTAVVVEALLEASRGVG